MSHKVERIKISLFEQNRDCTPRRGGQCCTIHYASRGFCHLACCVSKGLTVLPIVPQGVCTVQTITSQVVCWAPMILGNRVSDLLKFNDVCDLDINTIHFLRRRLSSNYQNTSQMIFNYSKD